MKHIQTILENELINLKTEYEREVLREEINGFYKNIQHKINSDLNDIETVVDNFLEKDEVFPIFTIPIHKNDISEYSDEFKRMDFSEIDIKKYKKNKIEQLFFSSNNEKLKQLENKVFKMKIILYGIEEEFEIKLEKANEYKEKEKKLYEAYSINGIRWKPFIMPYNDKFYDVIVTDNKFEEKFLKDINFDKIQYFFDDFEGEYYRDYHLMWNIEESKILSDGYIVSKNEKNLVFHQIESKSIGLTMVKPKDNENFSEIRQDEDNKIIIKTHLKKIQDWTLIIVKKINNLERYKNLKFSLSHNTVRKNTINQLREKYKNRIRSEIEIFRISKIYKFLDEIKLVKIGINDNLNEYSELINMYNYIENEFDKNINKDKLILYIEYPKDIILKEEKINYFGSIIQFFFPEYECRIKGVEI